jgi:diguanylate cyclase (GGDEF)-like protein
MMTTRPTIADFKRRFLLLMMISGAMFTSIFELGALSGTIPLTSTHFVANLAHIAASVTFTALLLRRPDLFLTLAWAHASSSFLVFLSALYNMPADEMRFLWFYVQAGGTFLLIGTVAGWATIALSIAVVVGSRMAGWVDLSVNGIGTFSLGLACAGAMFHAFNRQAARHAAELDVAYAIIDRAAHHDGLTGLLNLTGFRAVGSDLGPSALDTDEPVSVLFIDVDHFKAINDRFGHSGGDAVLVAVAAAIGAAVRPADVVARIGGEEIVVLLPKADAACAAVIAERVRAAVEAAGPEVGGQRLTVTASVGWATSEEASPSIDALVGAADAAMYRAKQAGRNRVEPSCEVSTTRARAA